MTGPAVRRLVLLAALLGGASCSTPNVGEPGLRRVTFNMGWLPQGSMSGVIVAIDHGLYRDAGLEVEAVRGFGGIRTANEIDQGMFDFGYGDPLAVILNRANGGKTRVVGALNQEWPAALCYVKGRHALAAPSDLRGLTVGGGRSSPMQMLVPVWLAANGVDAADVRLMQLDPAVVVASLLEGTIDVGECWRGNSIPLFQKSAEEAGVEIDWLEYRAFGLDIYGNGIVAAESLLDSEPEVVRGFLRATYEGYAYAIEHPEEASRIMLEHYPVLDLGVTRAQIDALASLLEAPGGLGSMQEEKIARTLTLVADAYAVEAELEPGDIFTTEFLP